MNWTLKEHGDWLEKQAADFITYNIPAYEQTWKLFIGHQGNGIIANLEGNIPPEDEKMRRDFAQHHYTILESLFLMQRASEDEEIRPVKSFEDYRATVNNIMLFQAYAGRLRDNFHKCFSVLFGSGSTKPDESVAKLSTFYNSRHVFIHGRKVPFNRDELGLISMPKIKTSDLDHKGYGSEMLWEQAENLEFQYNADYMKESMSELCALSQGLLQNLLDAVKALIIDHGWKLESPAQFVFSKNYTPPSGSTGTFVLVDATFPYQNFSGHDVHTSGVIHLNKIKKLIPTTLQQPRKKNKGNRKGN
jgi:hypothetical protein